MRVLPTILALACLGCTEHPTADESALVSKVEKLVTLPKGGGELKCYERHYTILRDKDAENYVGVPLDGLHNRALLVGHYRIGHEPGIYWAKNATELPEIADGGCHDVRVVYVVGSQEKSVPANCSATMAGVPPTEVTPPVTC